jgi:argininosuccinate lyase
MDPEALAYGASIPFDRRLALYDIQGSLAYANALKKARLITAKECQQIRKGLKEIGKSIELDKFHSRLEWEDVHTHIEKVLTQKIGHVGGKLHTGRSRNDQVATDLRLYCLDHLRQLVAGLHGLQSVLLEKAEAWEGVRIPGYTHLQRAQPVLLAHHLLAYVEMLSRDEERVQDALKRTSIMPLGSGALAGNPFPIDRAALAGELGFLRISHNSLDAVSDRDFAVEIASAASLLMIHLSRLSEELILWASSEFSFIRLPESFCTGSSMMPQKVNPDIPELIRAKSGRVIGDLVALLTMLKGLPLAYNKDLQEDKEPLFDIFDTLLATLSVLTRMLKATDIDEKRLNEAADDAVMLATDLADWLVGHKVPFRKAHEIVAQVVRYAADQGLSLSELPLKSLRRFSRTFTEDVCQHLKAERSIANRSVVGGTAPANVKKEIRRHRKRLSK